MSFNFKDDKARAKSSAQIYDNDEGKKNLTEYSRKTERVKELLDCFDSIHVLVIIKIFIKRLIIKKQIQK